MELESSWEDHDCGCLSLSKEDHTSESDVVDPLLEITTINDEEKDDKEKDDKEKDVCINSVLPDDILERVFGYLPVLTIIKAGCVCKKWYDMMQSERFIQNLPRTTSQKPWYFMFTNDTDPQGHVYDPMLMKWHRFEIPYIEMPSWNLVSSSGLVCFTDNDTRRILFVCNPITRCCRKLAGPYGTDISDYCALAISLDESSRKYTLAIVRSKQGPGEQADWGLSIDVYSSKSKSWACPVEVSLQAWRSGADSVICGGILYFVVYLTRTVGFLHPHYGVLAYDLASESFDLDVVECVISAPCPVTCMRLINIKEELVMVGGIEKQGRPGLIKGIGIWVLKEKKWEEVSRMPNKFFRGFGEFDDVFGSSGFDNLIYIQSYGTPALLMFEMNSKEWRWSHKCPATKKFPLQLFSGVCFEPRFDIYP